MSGRRKAGLVAALLAAGCSGASAPEPGAAPLPAGALARAGSELVNVATISRIAERQGVTSRVAVGLALSDALFAQGAREALSGASTRSLERAATARALLEQLQVEAAQAGPPTQPELDEIVKARWTELDRPDAVRTTHAVVMNDQPARDALARALAEKLAAALAHVTSSDELIRVAKAFPGEGFEIRAETLPFVTVDGRTLERHESSFAAQRGSFDLDFARTANALTAPGQLSPVSKSAFGYHLIRLDERAPGSVVSAAELPALLGPEVLLKRAQRLRSQLLERLKAGAPAQIERAADDLTSQVKVAP